MSTLDTLDMLWLIAGLWLAWGAVASTVSLRPTRRAALHALAWWGGCGCWAVEMLALHPEVR